jgi:hypothetical protein
MRQKNSDNFGVSRPVIAGNVQQMMSLHLLCDLRVLCASVSGFDFKR